MSKKKLNSKVLGGNIDDFWNDCLTNNQTLGEESEYVTCISFNLVSERKTRIQTNNSKTHKKEDIAIQLVKKYEDHNELKERESERKQKAIDRCLMMYENGKLKNEINKILFSKNEELKMKKEVSECTWKPKTNEKIKNGNEKSKVYYDKSVKLIDRVVKWKKKKEQKAARSRSQAKTDCTFKPEINTSNYRDLFNNDQAFSRADTKYLYRMNKARNVEEERRSKIGSVRNIY
jgi:hypothetical protein